MNSSCEISNKVHILRLKYYLISEHGNPYPINVYQDFFGFDIKGQQAKCRICGVKATFKYEVYNHLYEPLGSDYYCYKDKPGIPPRAIIEKKV